jgi:Spy/CpxP family protein refolding chaperone
MMNKLYSTIKPFLAMSVIALAVTSLNVNAMGHNSEGDNSKTKMSQQKGESNKHGNMKKRLHRLAKKLDLTSEQRVNVKEIFANIKNQRHDRKDVLSGFKEQVQSLVLMSEFDESQFKAIYAEHQASFQAIEMEKAKMRHAILQVLSPEQQQKFLTMHKRRGDLR